MLLRAKKRDQVFATSVEPCRNDNDIGSFRVQRAEGAVSHAAVKNHLAARKLAGSQGSELLLSVLRPSDQGQSAGE